LLVVLREAAVQDISAAADWYHQQRPGLGSDFLSQVEICVALMLDHPEAFPRVESDVRRALVRRFPFSLYFRRLDSETIEVVSVLHQRRDTNRRTDG